MKEARTTWDTLFQFYQVRLKACQRELGFLTPKFQFYQVRLKVVYDDKFAYSHQFQFYQVRLKEWGRIRRR